MGALASRSMLLFSPEKPLSSYILNATYTCLGCLALGVITSPYTHILKSLPQYRYDVRTKPSHNIKYGLWVRATELANEYERALGCSTTPTVSAASLPSY